MGERLMKVKRGSSGAGETFRYMLHHCEVTVEGLDRERAINRLIKAGIGMMQMREHDDITFSFICSYDDAKKIGKIIGKNYLASIDAHAGIIPFARTAVRRSGLVIGIAIICIMLIAQQNIVTQIDIEGHYKTDEDALRGSLAKQGLSEGAAVWKIDNQEIENSILADYSDIRWINIERQGSRVWVHIAEGSLEDAEEKSAVHDVVAAKSGYVTRVIARDGQALVKPGDYVEKGQVLISCFVPINNTTYDTSRDDSARVADADGIIEATVIYKLSAEFEAGKYSEEEMKSIMEDKIREFMRENILQYIKICNKDLKFEQEENIIVCSATLEVSENIAEQKENELAENGSGENGTESVEGSENND